MIISTMMTTTRMIRYKIVNHTLELIISSNRNHMVSISFLLFDLCFVVRWEVVRVRSEGFKMRTKNGLAMMRLGKPMNTLSAKMFLSDI